MKYKIALLIFILLPSLCFANMNGGLHISTTAIVLFFGTALLVLVNGILCFVNMFIKKRGIRNFNIFATSLLFIAAVYLLTQNAKSGIIAFSILLIHVLFIRLSMIKKVYEEQE